MDKDYLKVEGEEGLVRDPASNAIINTNKKAWVNHKMRRRKVQEKDAKIEALENDVAELKEMVRTLLESNQTAKRRTTKSTEEKSE